MSCNTECDNTQPPMSGSKISQLPYLGSVDGNDMFVVVDVSNNETKYTDYLTILYYDSSASSLSASSIPSAIDELDYKLSLISSGGTSGTMIHNSLSGLQGGVNGEYYHLSEYDYNFISTLITSGDGLVLSGGQQGQVLTKKSDNSYDVEWKDVSGSSGIHDVLSAGTYLRKTGDWVGSDVFTSNNYYTSGDINNMFTYYAPVSAIGSLSAAVEHNTVNIYTNSASLNAHISATNNPHSTSYLNLTDTDNMVYSGFSGYNVVVNDTETGLVFSPQKDSNTNAPYIYRLSTVVISNGEFRTDNATHSNVNYIYVHKYDNNGLDRGDGLHAVIKSDLISINNGATFANYKVISDGAYWTNDVAEFAVTPLSNSGIFNDKSDIHVELMFRGATAFDQLNDTPVNKVGSAGKVVAVNATENALEYIDINTNTPALSAVTNAGNITEDDIVVGVSSGTNITITDGNGGGYPGIAMRHVGQEAYVLFDEPNERIAINRNLRGRVVYTPTSGTDYIQYETLMDAISGVTPTPTTGYWTSGVSTSGSTRLFPTIDYDQVDIGVLSGVDLGGELNVESEVLITGDIDVISSDVTDANGKYQETSSASGVWKHESNTYYVYLINNTWVVSSDNLQSFSNVIAYKQANISVPIGTYAGYNGHSNVSVSDDSGNIYNDAIAAKGSVYASGTIKTSSKFVVGDSVTFGNINDTDDGVLITGNAESTSDKLIFIDKTTTVFKILSDSTVEAPETTIGDIDSANHDKTLTTKEWVLDKINTTSGGQSPITTVFARIGDIVAVSGDYTATLIDYDDSVTMLSATNVQDAIYASYAQVIDTSLSLSAHMSDNTIHFTQTEIDYGNIQNKPSIPSSINDLSDVNTSTPAPATGQLLEWDGTNWVPVDKPSVYVPASGITNNRPSNPVVGFPYFSTDLGYTICWNGSNWVNATGAYVIGPK